MRGAHRISFDGLLAASVALMVFAFACGSSSVGPVFDAGQELRWVALGTLLAVSVVHAALHARPLRPLPPAYLGAAAITVLGFVSGTWSVSPRLTAARAVSLGILFVAAGAIGLLARARPSTGERVLVAVLGGAVAVVVAGIVLLAVDRSNAVQEATSASPARFRGLTENPNEVSLLAALALPIALGLLTADAGRRGGSRAALAAAALLLVGAIAASGSRGSLAAALLGAVVVLAATSIHRRARVIRAAAAVVVAAVAYAIAQVPDPAPPFAASRAPTPERQAAPYQAYPALACVELPPDDVGQPPCGETVGPGGRGLEDSGRLAAWEGALDQSGKRPLLGYGFGTEDEVFVDRYSEFQGSRAESSYIGIVLQLGAAGVALLVLLLLALVAGARRLGRLHGGEWVVATVCLGIVSAGILIGAYQSYLYSVGNLGAGTFWISGFVLAALSSRRGFEERPA